MTFQFYNQLFLSYGLELSPDTEVATTDQILPLVRHELGLAFVPKAMARESIMEREIVQIPLKEEIPKRDICMVLDNQHPLSAAARQLKNMILQAVIYPEAPDSGENCNCSHNTNKNVHKHRLCPPFFNF